MARYSRLLLPLLAGLLGTVGSAQQPELAAHLDGAFDAIDKAVQSSQVPGMVVGITDRKGAVRVVFHGYADIKTKTPIAADSLFAIGSITKSFTAIALMQMFDEGRFDPKAPVTKYLPWFAVQSKFGPITGHH